MPEPLTAASMPPRIDRVVLLALLIGVAVRAAHYLSGRSLWLDEAMIALNIDQRSFAQLAESLDFNQAAPLGFLWLEKLAVLPFGTSELALRFWPLVAGVAALFVFARLARRMIGREGAMVACLLFALSAPLTYYAAEVKQYSFDVLVACLLPWLALRADEADEPAAWRMLAVSGVVAVWLSHPVVFVLPGAAIYLWLADRNRADGTTRTDRTARVAGLAAAWGISFAAAYWLTARDVSQSPLMARFWAEGFAPVPPPSAADLAWYADAFTGWIRGAFDFTETDSPLRTATFWIGGALAVAGAVATWSRDRRHLLLVASPIVLAFLASALRLYPFQGRSFEAPRSSSSRGASKLWPGGSGRPGRAIQRRASTVDRGVSGPRLPPSSSLRALPSCWRTGWSNLLARTFARFSNTSPTMRTRATSCICTAGRSMRHSTTTGRARNAVSPASR